MNEVWIVAAARTPIGRFGGALANGSAVGLGSAVLRAVGAQVPVPNEVILGNVLSAGLGQNVARQAAVGAGYAVSVPAFTVDKVCGSGLKAVVLAAQAIRAGDSQVVLAGGTEHMSGAPYLLRGSRWGQRLGHGELTDTVIGDALWDAFGDTHMGVTAENVAARCGVSRSDQDAFALRSQERAAAAEASGAFDAERVAVSVPGAKGAVEEVVRDEHPRPETTLESLARLKPAFLPDGTVTAGNASGINDGAAAVAVVDAAIGADLAAPWAFRVVAAHSAGIEPSVMGLGPVAASRGALSKVGWSVSDLDRIEVNEAFAAQAVAVNREMGWDEARVNVHGGAIALGHPVGASGARVLVTLLHALVRCDGARGLASLCIGGGQGIALLVERVR